MEITGWRYLTWLELNDFGDEASARFAELARRAIPKALPVNPDDYVISAAEQRWISLKAWCLSDTTLSKIVWIGPALVMGLAFSQAS